jgi:hypothetical protein
MRGLALCSLAAAALCAGCVGLLVVEDQPPRPVVVEKSRPPGRHASSLGIPPGHLPPPGECRIWLPGRPPGHQPPPGHCSDLKHEVPAGAWLLYRPKREHVRVSVCHASRPSVIVAVYLYDATTGKFLHEERQ